MATTDILAAPHTEAQPEVTRIRPSRGWRAIDLREIWRYRELLWFLTLRDVKLRYKQTALGVAWVVIQPHTRFVGTFSLREVWLVDSANCPRCPPARPPAMRKSPFDHS